MRITSKLFLVSTVFFCEISFAQNNIQKAIFNACEASAKDYSGYAWAVAQVSKEIKSELNLERKNLMLSKMLSDMESIKDREFTKLEKFRDSVRSSDFEKRAYDDVYFSTYRQNLEYALAIGMNKLDYTEVRFKLDIESDCKKRLFK